MKVSLNFLKSMLPSPVSGSQPVEALKPSSQQIEDAAKMVKIDGNGRNGGE